MRKVRSNNLGFTLVELIVVIALMISLLVIAIVSFVNISDSKKEESWELVKDQIETAAIDFFGANEYLFEGQGNQDVDGYVTVSKLVNDDYLGRVVDPRDGMVVDGCTYVEITRNANGAIDAEYQGDLTKDPASACETSGKLVSTTVAGAPDIDVKYFKEDHTTEITDETMEKDWINKSDLADDKKGIDGDVLSLKITSKNNTPIDSLTIKEVNDNSKISNQGENYWFNDDDNGNLTRTVVASNNGRESTAEFTYNKDSIPPTGSIALATTDSQNRYNTADVKVNVSAGDTTSGLASGEVFLKGSSSKKWTWSGDKTKSASYTSLELFDKYNGSSASSRLKLTDVAGNFSNIDGSDYVVYNQCQDPNYKQTNEVKKNECASDGVREYDVTEIDTLTKNACGPTTRKKVNCSVKGILLLLDYDTMQKKPGPNANNVSGKPIFKELNKNPGNTYPYSPSFKRSMNVTVGYTPNTCNDNNAEECAGQKKIKDIGYAGSACRNVGDYRRNFKFKVVWIDDSTSNYQDAYLNVNQTKGTGTYFKGRTSPFTVTIEDIKQVYRYGCDYSDSINVNTCGSGSKTSSHISPNVTTHVYKLTIKDGYYTGTDTIDVVSNTVSLYTRYMAECGY